MNIFFPNVGRRCELVEAFARALTRVSPGLIWGSDPQPLAPALAVVDRVAPLPPDCASQAYLDALAEFLVREQIDLVIPTIDPDLLRLDAWRATLAERAPKAHLLLSPTATIQTARDKRRSRDAFASLGAAVPRAVDPNAPDLAFPLFIKPAAGSASIGAMRIDSPAELATAVRNTQDPMVEELIGGDETTVDVLLDFEGRPLAAVPRRRLQVRGGEVTRGVVERNPGLEALALQVTQGLGCTGPVTLQFRHPEPQRWVAMELNARMGGGLPLSIAAGADWPRWILELALGRQPDVSTSARDRMHMSRADRSFFSHPEPVREKPWPAGRKLPQLVIFDMDDTLYPESDFVMSGYRAAAQAAWQDLGIDIEPELRRRFLSGQRGDLFTAALRSFGLNPDEHHVRTRLVEAYRQHSPSIRPHVETLPVLQALRATGHRLALLSDGWAEVQRRKFDALGLAPYFDAVVFTDELGRDAWKPSSIGFEAILDRLSIEADDAIYVADNPAKDFVAPRLLGMDSVRIVRPGMEHGKAIASDKNQEAAWMAHALSELLPSTVGSP